MKWILVAAVLLTSAQGTMAQPVENIAIESSYTLEPMPNYARCNDAADLTQLTDGKYTKGYFWIQPSTVGWQEKKPVIITLDLGEVKPIRGISFHTAAGFADVKWPLAIRVLTAGEDKKFHEIGDLVKLSAEQQGPLIPTKVSEAVWAEEGMTFNDAEINDHFDRYRDRYPQERLTPEVRRKVIGDLNKQRAEQYGTYRYWTDRLRTHGRYVSLVVWNEPFTFMDEIEVYAGEPDWVNEPLIGPAITDVKGYAGRIAIQQGIQTRLARDIQVLRKAVEQKGVPLQTQRDVLGELTAVEEELGKATVFGDDFLAILPLNSWHERVLRTQAWLWRAKGLKPLTFWRSNLWDPLPYIGMPDMASDLVVEVHLMRKEYRAAAFNVSNSSDGPMQVMFRLSGLPGGDNPGYITVHEAVWTDTRKGVPVAAALPELVAEDNLYTVEIPSGMTRQVWLTFNPVDVEAGTHEGELVVESVHGGTRFPLHMHLYPLDFPEKRSLHLGGWDYTDKIGHHSMVTEKNRSVLIQHLRERFVDSPWGTPRVLTRGTHDVQGVMTTLPDTDYFDSWIALWPDAAQYLVFAKVGPNFESWSMDTPEFTTAVKEWVTFWAGYAIEKGLKPEQLAVLLVDEPHEGWHEDIILAWAKAIRAAGTGVRIWEDPTYRDMNQAMEEMIDACHVLCPNYQAFLSRGQAYRDYYVKKRDQGIALEFYSAWTSRVFDPYAARLMAWMSWRYGASAIYCWSLTDTGGASSWNEYVAIRDTYAPLFISEDSVTAGKHLEAAREGVEDYEYFVMLDRAIREAHAQGANGPEVEEARQLLESLPVRVCDAVDQKVFPNWLRENVDRTLADKARIQILTALTSLAQN